MFHGKMNRHLHEEGRETISETNINEYQTIKWREAGRSAENGKKRQIPHARMILPPHLFVNDGTYRPLAVKWAMGTFPPMSNSSLRERFGKCGEEAFKTIQEGLRHSPCKETKN